MFALIFFLLLIWCRGASCSSKVALPHPPRTISSPSSLHDSRVVNPVSLTWDPKVQHSGSGDVVLSISDARINESIVTSCASSVIVNNCKHYLGVASLGSISAFNMPCPHRLILSTPVSDPAAPSGIALDPHTGNAFLNR